MGFPLKSGRETSERERIKCRAKNKSGVKLHTKKLLSNRIVPTGKNKLLSDTSSSIFGTG
jgi:hypothetical protein